MFDRFKREVPTYWRSLYIDGKRQRGAAHRYPRFYYRAVCGHSAEKQAQGFLFELRDEPHPEVECAKCRLRAAMKEIPRAEKLSDLR